jgi:shikimate kinase
MVSATALCYGAASIVNAIATGKGAAFGIGLETRVTVELKESKSVDAILDREEDPKLVELCVKKVLGLFNYEPGAKVTVESNIPVARGLKSSSVVANAAVLAAFGALAKKYGKLRMMRVDKHTQRQQLYIEDTLVKDDLVLQIAVDAAREAGVTITGALDDAASSYYGGFVVTDNLGNKILRRGEMENMSVVVFVPEKKIYTREIDVRRMKLFAREANVIWNMALNGDLYTAMTLNGLLYSGILGQEAEIAMAAFDAGAIAAGLSGTGPAVVALTKRDPDRITTQWHAFEGKIMETKVNNQKARIVE